MIGPGKRGWISWGTSEDSCGPCPPRVCGRVIYRGVWLSWVVASLFQGWARASIPPQLQVSQEGASGVWGGRYQPVLQRRCRAQGTEGAHSDDGGGIACGEKLANLRYSINSGEARLSLPSLLSQMRIVAVGLPGKRLRLISWRSLLKE